MAQLKKQAAVFAEPFLGIFRLDIYCMFTTCSLGLKIVSLSRFEGAICCFEVCERLRPAESGKSAVVFGSAGRYSQPYCGLPSQAQPVLSCLLPRQQLLLKYRNLGNRLCPRSFRSFAMVGERK